MIVYPHRIRLRGPWDCEPLARFVGGEGGTLREAADGLPPPRRVTMPCRWGEAGLTGFAGRVRFRRRFGYPGRIDECERVWLTFDTVAGSAEVALNGETLGTIAETAQRGEFHVTRLLQPRNELLVLVAADADRGGLPGDVALEVRRTAFLRDVTARLVKEGASERLEVTGAVVGTSERPLDLYALVDNRTAGYTTIMPREEGARFHLVTEPRQDSGFPLTAPSTRTTLRLELVDGGVIWYGVDVPAASA